jgi:hypothetical protein
MQNSTIRNCTANLLKRAPQPRTVVDTARQRHSTDIRGDEFFYRLYNEMFSHADVAEFIGFRPAKGTTRGYKFIDNARVLQSFSLDYI